MRSTEPTSDTESTDERAADGVDSTAARDFVDALRSGGSFDPTRWSQTADETDATEAVCRLVFGGLAVAIVLVLIGLLPGIDVAGPTFAAVGSAVLTVSFVAVFGYLAIVLPSFVHALSGGPTTLREHVASVTFWTMILGAILVAHRGFAPLIELLGGTMWFYDVLFLLAAIGPVALIARELWYAIDPAASYVSTHISGDASEPTRTR
ncbi:hypothetical protein [Halovivax gelatinilyticus]|uniref:hypothetical protein n=1 Tax=Halovivax gelatinilyticus TaxID=2961597 RepID=UPI0020CA3219|nr:hypothetical protein [Halovivax gelatinilyticus]